ncbi:MULTISPECIES: bifunctional transcriptional activator/DNA repair enzyme AdaA [Pasteurellaceae]|uniref:Methylated-DNA--protein-cysteine methyltransferase n=1 Tax=Pasteurella atlantica TaxID=2827233 RepID=A0AAW8CMP0_9PAST|nr:bifunctional transcriptional activator/DNA repair protein Ada [Pasteurella atlantica]MBR0572662.1 bifunctional transcriptional activator/DNA repair protein Ada [Pasteurella atlantica]MDP8038606.1 methylated-DNA--[protein]-cysteine S-methyltransferase [Pasteurella atlantica]MDP8040698.1 methylated-DNA--[protein]-cysteine S-methyltransferase [Pasteurella atlantica]MDP8042833.1 methylated-DNA--[protein]-cysteine S-methyltransferase [Pasteurella atlantica]MDP8044920.1 methylated-DNA--[protein]-
MRITDKKTINTYYTDLLERNQQFVGIFFVGVKTTSVFCIATCRARKPKLENVEFYTTFKEALDNGYRPCKICKPTENANKAPKQVELAIQLVKENPKEKITDYQLRQKGISPDVVRRWFNKHYGMTFQAYQRMYRINNAYQELKKGKNTTHTAFDSGYESLSGFGYTFKKMIGKSPKNSNEKSIILISRLTTPLGAMFACATENGICLLEFVDRRMLETEFRDLQKRLNAKILTGENKHITQVKKELTEYFEGTRKTFDVKLDTPGTDFQQSVWNALQEIEYGTTTTYQTQAEKINNPKAIRAVAAANGYNRISIIIPCHRVIGKNGKLTGYGGGIERKKWLIEHERKNINR